MLLSLSVVACSADTPEAQLREYDKLLDRLNRTCKEPRAQLADSAMAYAQSYQLDYGAPVTALDIVRSTAAAIRVEPIMTERDKENYVELARRGLDSVWAQRADYPPRFLINCDSIMREVALVHEGGN
jgi:hypothetical protein